MSEVSTYVAEVEFRDGTRIDLGSTDIVVVVGPNNSGKSLMLRDLGYQLRGEGGHSVTVKRLKLAKIGSEEQLWEFIRARGIYNKQPHRDEYVLAGTSYSREHVRQWPRDYELAPFHEVFSRSIDAESRLGLASATSSIDFGRESKSQPLHYLHQDAELRGKLSKWFKTAFDTDIAIDLLAGNVIPLYVGKNVSPQNDEDHLSASYRARLRQFPRLDTQGDGMRSFVGVLLHILLLDRPIAIVDEPEAFLHPPQALLLGQLVARERQTDKQVFMATHSIDLLRGLLLEGGANVRVIRLTRDGDLNKVATLSASDIQEVWNDPVLRYSNALDGLFHQKTIVCEADGDCRFYHAIADALRESPDHAYARDIQFVQAGGKGAVAKIVRALKKISISVAAVVDFDILRDTGQLRAVVDALGGNFDLLKADYDIVRRSIDDLGFEPAVSIKDKVVAAIDSLPDPTQPLSSTALRKLRATLRNSIGWERAKSSGLALLPIGQARTSGTRLLAGLRGIGLFVVPSGEIETFAPEEVKTKNQWVNSTLLKFGDSLDTAFELAAARDFVASFIGST